MLFALIDKMNAVKVYLDKQFQEQFLSIRTSSTQSMRLAILSRQATTHNRKNALACLVLIVE